MTAQLVVSAAVLVFVLVTFGGCASSDDPSLALRAGKASGVLKEATTIPLPLDAVRRLEAAMYDRIMDGIDAREIVCAAPPAQRAALKLPAFYCRDLSADRDAAMDAHRKARRILDAPDLVEADGERIVELMVKALGGAVKAAK